MRRVTTLALLSTVVGAGAAGCYPKSKGEMLARNTAEQERRIQALEEGMEDQRERMQAALTAAEQKVAQLEEVLEQATDVVTRNSADLGTEVRELRQSLQAMEGQLAELRNEVEQTQRALGESREQLEERINQASRKSGGDPPVDPSTVPADAGENFAAGTSAMEAGEHGRARGIFRVYLERHAQEDQADDAARLIGRSYAEEDQHTQAVRAYARVISQYRTGDAVPQTLFDMAESYFALKECGRAIQTLEGLIQMRSRLTATARRKLREVQRARRDRDRCNP